MLPGHAVERDLRKRELLGPLLFHPSDDLVRDLCRVPAGAGYRAAVVHRCPGQVEVVDRVPRRIDHETALLIPDLAVREILSGARVPRVRGDLRLVMVMAERDVIEAVGQDRAVELMLRDGRKPLVLYRCRKAVGHEHVIPAGCQFDRIVGRAVILHAEHVRDQVEDRIPDLHPLVSERVRGVDLRGVVIEDRERRGSVPGLHHAMVAGHDHERDPGFVKPGERVEHGRVGPGLGLDRIEEVARVDEHVGLFPDDHVNRSKEVIVDLLLAQVHPRFRVEPGKCGEAEVRVCDMDELHSLRFLVGVCWHIRGRGAGGK